MATEQLQKLSFLIFLKKSPPSWFKKIIVYYRSEAIRWQIKSPLLICGFDFFFFLKPTRKRRAQGKSCKELFQNLWKSLRAIKKKTLQGTKKLDYTFPFSSLKTQHRLGLMLLCFLYAPWPMAILPCGPQGGKCATRPGLGSAQPSTHPPAPAHH